MAFKAHDLVIAVLLVLLFGLLSLPVQLGLTYWGDSVVLWAVYALVGMALAVYVLFAFLRSARRLLGAEAATPETLEADARARRAAIGVFGGMLVIWILLGGISFVRDRNRPDPHAVRFASQSAVDGKRVFQAYNCMGCHTIVGNGAYLGPDLTKIAKDAGPAWLAAFLSAAGTWPTRRAVDGLVDEYRSSRILDVASPDDYYARYSGARRRVTDRGGTASLMPNLTFRAEEVPALVAFLDYASRIDTAGWPPTPRPQAGVVERVQTSLRGPSVAVVTTPAAATPSAGAVREAKKEDPAHEGQELVQQLGCVACHSADGTPRVGPTWKGLFGGKVPLDNGQTVVADDAYLRESLLQPNAKIVKGFPPGVMPSYAGRVSKEELDQAIAYIESLR